jgi:hypothetical protein
MPFTNWLAELRALKSDCAAAALEASFAAASAAGVLLDAGTVFKAFAGIKRCLRACLQGRKPAGALQERSIASAKRTVLRVSQHETLRANKHVALITFMWQLQHVRCCMHGNAHLQFKLTHGQPVPSSALGGVSPRTGWR